MSGALGLSCPKGGSFYICAGNATEFIGCCTTDPCADGSGDCQDKHLAPATFSSDAYDDIPPQDCASGLGLWYTCKLDTPPFLGCCKTNPCNGGSGCPAGLVGATLSHNEDYRRRFLESAGQRGAASSSSAPTTAPARSSTSAGPPPPTSSSSGAPATLAQPPTEAVSGGSGPGTGAIAGIAVGAVVVLAAVVAVLFYLRHKKRRRDADSAGGKLPAGAMWDSTTAYHGTYRHSNNTGPTLAGTVSEIESPRMSAGPKPMHSYYSPETLNRPFSGESRITDGYGRVYDVTAPTIRPIHEMEATPGPWTAGTRPSHPQMPTSPPPWSYNQI